ncbi:MAG TPA: hypothetical protein VEB66_11415 [Opitutaceae bacterium]|nr:hypothetical protein [Opitutaceae bacterium]
MSSPIVPFAIVAVVIVIAIAAGRRTGKKIAGLRMRGLYPPEGKESDDDVLRLLEAGEKTLAIRCYRSLHQVNLRTAKEAVALLEEKNA